MSLNWIHHTTVTGNNQFDFSKSYKRVVNPTMQVPFLTHLNYTIKGDMIITSHKRIILGIMCIMGRGMKRKSKALTQTELSKQFRAMYTKSNLKQELYLNFMKAN